MTLYAQMCDTCSSIIEELQEIRDLLLEVKEVRALIKNISDSDRERELRFASLDKKLKLRKKKRKQLIVLVSKNQVLLRLLTAMKMTKMCSRNS